MAVIICGSGVTDNSYYYVDCCGNSVRGMIPGQIVTLDYTQPYNGIKILNIEATPNCPTPNNTSTPTSTPTPTITASATPKNTSTPTPTPTKTPCPTTSPAVSLINECLPITIFPMGVSCNVIKQPSSPTSFDGILSLFITGGTSPYSFYWNTGERTQTIYNLPSGSYTVLVVDYYGDFSSTTVCSLIAPTGTPTPTPTMTNTPTPTLSVPTLCFLFYQPGTSSSSGLSTGLPQQLQLQFTPNGTMNGKPKWFNSQQNLTVFWNSSTSTWQIQGWTYGGQPTSTNSGMIPLNLWSFIGTPGVYQTITVTQGNCPVYPPLTFSTQIRPATCSQNTCNGSLFVNAVGGLAPYSYSIDGTNFQLSNIFTNLCPTTFTLTVKDTLSNTLRQTITIPYNSTLTTYSISLIVDNFSNPTPDTEIFDWHIEITPPLPAGLTMNFQIVISNLQEIQGPYNYNPQTTAVITSTNTVYKDGVIQTLSSTSPTTQLVPNACNPSTLTTQQKTFTQTTQISMMQNTTVNGRFISNINLLNPVTVLNCTSTGINTIKATLSQIQIQGSPCVDVNYNQPPIGIVNHTVIGQSN